MTRILVAFLGLFLVAQIPPDALQRWSPYVFFVGMGVLMLEMALGYADRGAQRWLDFGVIRFQPSERILLALRCKSSR